MSHRLVALCLLMSASQALWAAEPDLNLCLAHPILGDRWTIHEVVELTEARVPSVPACNDAAAWEKYATKLRADVLDRIVYRGEAASWRDAKTRVEWLETSPGGNGYHIKKLRYEALPGMWIPALLYEPEKLTGKVPVVMNVNGLDPVGKAAKYKQIRCINQAKRGMIALNVEWFGMGQLRTDGFVHERMNQIDLCGSSGLAPFYLSMKRGLDVLLSLDHADPERVAVTGLSGGGWQTIFISALDTRVTLTDPVAGYSSFKTRSRHVKDLGDPEQTPTDLATLADYTHLTALMAPRATLLTFNAKDDCCFEAGYALPPLLNAAEPIFRLYGKETYLRYHVSHVPGTHAYEKDNREALYRMVGDFFYPDEAHYDAHEIPCDDEIKTKEQLAVDLPADNLDFHALAVRLSKDLPRNGSPPADRADAEKRRKTGREKLREIVRATDWTVQADADGDDGSGDGRGGVTPPLQIRYWRLRLGDDWTVPAVALWRGEPKRTAVLICDGGRRSAAADVDRLLQDGARVLAIDPFDFGEAKPIYPGGDAREPKYASNSEWELQLATVGERSLGIQASQVAAVARWARSRDKAGPVVVVSSGPRTTLIALVAGALEETAIDAVELHGSAGSLKERIERNEAFDAAPEAFCFGLLEAFDVKQLAGLCAPRPVRFVEPSERIKVEMAELKKWYAAFGSDFDPLQ
ncbi:MAG TPA: acetylxylan esterase [Gemmataceae bacterium]|nr:acetylxylan esterase [Gemmataceae bacterium]